MHDCNRAWIEIFLTAIDKIYEQVFHDVKMPSISQNMYHYGGPNSHHLLHWVEKCHQRACIRWETDGRAVNDADEMALSCASGILEELCDQPWERVPSVLEHHHRSLTFDDTGRG